MTLNTTVLYRCIETLRESFVFLKKQEPSSIEYEIFRNATVKGYELTLEMSGKLLKKALKPYFSSPREVDALVFKDLLRHAGKHGLLHADEVSRWFIYRDNRNNTAHDYGIGFAEETLTLLPGFIEDASHLEERLRHADA